MNQAKTYFVSTLLLALTLSQQTLTSNPKNALLSPEAHQTVVSDNFDDLFDIEVDAIDDAQSQHLVEQAPTSKNRDGEECSPQDTIDMLFLLAPNLKEILQEDLYYHTNPINTRSLLDQPLFTTRLFHPAHAWYASADIFWNKTNHANFTKKSSHICSYLALNNEDIFQLLPAGCEKYSLTIFPLLANGHLEERKFGSMFQAGYSWNRFTLRGMTPLYYFERNYQLTQEEKNALMVQFGDVTEDEQERFQREHMISDKFGLGDTRLYGEFNLFKKPTYRINAGPLVTLPTAFAMINGLKGSHYKPCCQRPTVDFQETCACALDADFTNLINLGYQALDTLSAIILEDSLGNRRHFGLGGFFDWEQNLSSFVSRPWTKNIQIKNYLSLEYLVPGNETRYFINPADIADYDSRDFHNPDQAVDNLHFLETELIDTIFPFNFKTRVSPGYVFWCDSQIAYQGERMGFSTGLDFWLKSKEKLSSIHSCTIPCSELAIECAHAPLASQLKILGNFSYTLTRPTRQWFMGIGADKTFISTGIGKDYTVNAFLRASF